MEKYNSSDGERQTVVARGDETAKVGYAGTAVAGPGGTAISGCNGHAVVGDYGNATAGDYGVAISGDHGTATAGYCGTATVGKHGRASTSYHGTVSAGEGGELRIAYWHDGRKYAAVARVGDTVLGIGKSGQIRIQPHKPYRLAVQRDGAVRWVLA